MSNNDDFYNSIRWANDVPSRVADIQQNESVQQLTDAYRIKHALALPAEAGTRVSFIQNMGAVLSYDQVPQKGEEGEVVTVRSSSLGDLTSFNDHVFVKWDSGKFGSYHVTDLRRSKNKTASLHQIRTSGLGDITAFLPSSTGDNDLVHRATRDLWSFRNDGEGYVIERLFDETGEPLTA